MMACNNNTYISCIKRSREGACVPSGQQLNVGSSPTVGAVFSAMKEEFVVVAEQVHPLGPAYSFPHKKDAGRELLLLYPHHLLLNFVGLLAFNENSARNARAPPPATLSNVCARA